MRLTIYIDSKGRVIPANNISAPACACARLPHLCGKEKLKITHFCLKEGFNTPASCPNQSYPHDEGSYDRAGL